MWDRLATIAKDMGVSSSRPEDSFTAAEYGEKMGCSAGNALKILNKMLQKDKLERGKCGNKTWWRIK